MLEQLELYLFLFMYLTAKIGMAGSIHHVKLMVFP